MGKRDYRFALGGRMAGEEKCLQEERDGEGKEGRCLPEEIWRLAGTLREESRVEEDQKGEDAPEKGRC